MSCVLIILLASISCLAYDHHGPWKSQLKTDLETYIITRQKFKSLTDSSNRLKFPQPLSYLPPPEERDMGDYICNICDIFVEIAINARKQGVSKDIIAEIFTKGCIELEMQSELSCRTYISNNIDIWLYAVDNKPLIRSKTYCAYMLQAYRCQDPDRVNWTVNIPPKPILQNTIINNQNNRLDSSLRILHLTDVHYDPAYEPGSDTNCGLPLCCQKGSKARTDEEKAGNWGAYSCDSPWNVIENLLDHVMEKHKTFDMVYFTGDIIKHSEWLTGIPGNSKDIIKVFDKFKEVFYGIPLFPILGNHEPHPAHQYSSDGVSTNTGLSTQWLYDLVAESWKTWLPAEALETVLKGGYYTLIIKPGLRLIALNSNVCYTANNWLFFTDEDPLGQLQWMVDVLQHAEQNSERVHIISHIPSSDLDCFFNWASEYVRILERYSHVIAAQFNGHTHDEDTIVYFNSSNRSEAIGLAFIGGSATTFTNLNPNYKVFDVNPNTYDVLNFETWTFNITEANLTPNEPPFWYKLYDFKQAFGVPSLHPQDIAELALRMTKESTLLQKYYRFKKRDADPALVKGCNMQCEINNLCYIVTPWYGDDSYCKYYTELYLNNNVTRV